MADDDEVIEPEDAGDDDAWPDLSEGEPEGEDD